ncbi:transmembrane protein 241-like isoform X3 [Sceloporus undulatus]|uniref:transmembrane protein 241-like isoform X3 n=2 Tax=Sceloporus undulatus TaxID=8520 RepID=UPI001C4C59AD|nr:transmembrane protein 241-like isoform X3 [Sceloporus undulatus]XP_042299320.1 transmembrane protein 241-like isoform X3 [Sceloporus undulatus]
MSLKRPATGLAFCLFFLASYITNKMADTSRWISPTHFLEDRLGGNLHQLKPIPIFLTLHNAAEVITYGIETFVQKEQISAIKICRMLILLVAAGCLPLYDPQFDTDGYFWAFMHVLSVGAYKVYHKSWTPSSLSISEQQYINYAFSMVMLAFASHPTGDLFSALEFPFLYFYRFHSSCFASGVLGFFLTFHTMKLKNNTSTGQYAAWSFLAKVITAGLSPLFFEITMNVPTACCLLLGGFAEVLLLYIERTGT